MGKLGPSKDTLIKAIIARDRGISYSKILRGCDITPGNFELAITKSLQKLINHATGRKRETLEAIAYNETRKTNLFYMGPRFAEKQYDNIVAGHQKRFHRGTYMHPENVEDIIHHAIVSHNKVLGSHNRAKVIQAVKDLPSRLTDYLFDIGLKNVISNGFRDSDEGTTFAALKAFDRAYQRNTGDVSLFDLTQKDHLHGWGENFRAPMCYWKTNGKPNTRKVEIAVYHILTEEHPDLGSKDRTEVIQTMAALPLHLQVHLFELGLENIMIGGFVDEEYKSTPALLKAFDREYSRVNGNPELFDSNQPTYLSAEAFVGFHNKKPRVAYNRIFHPTCANNGDLVSLDQVLDEIKVVEATGASLFLGDILQTAIRTGETPHLVLDSRDALSDYTWDQLVEMAGISYNDHIQHKDPKHNGTNGKVNGKNGHKTSRFGEGMQDNMEFQPIEYHEFLTKPLEGEEPQEVLEELLDPNYEPTVIRKPINKLDSNSDLKGFDYFKAHMYRRPLLTKEEEVHVAKEIKCYELRARQAAHFGDLDAHLKYKHMWGNAVQYLTESNMRMVLKEAYGVAKEKSLPVEELIQEGTEGLIRGIHKFEYWRGLKLSTYAIPWIKQKIGRYGSDKSREIRIPVNSEERRHKIIHERRQYHERTGDHLSELEVAERLELTLAQVQNALNVSINPKSFYAPTGDGDTWNLLEAIKDESQYTGQELMQPKEALERVEGVLDSCTLYPEGSPLHIDLREEYVLRFRNALHNCEGSQSIGRGFHRRILTDMGKRMKISRERVRQLEVRAVKKFRAALQLEGVMPDSMLEQQYAQQPSA